MKWGGGQRRQQVGGRKVRATGLLGESWWCRGCGVRGWERWVVVGLGGGSSGDEGDEGGGATVLEAGGDLDCGDGVAVVGSRRWGKGCGGAGVVEVGVVWGGVYKGVRWCGGARAVDFVGVTVTVVVGVGGMSDMKGVGLLSNMKLTIKNPKMPLEKGDAAEETLVVMQKKLIGKQNKTKPKKRPLEENVDTEETSPKKLKSSNKKKNNGDVNKKMATLKPVQLKVTKLPHGILPWILKAFDYTCNMFKMKKTEFIITKDDVHDIFLLPRGGNEVVLAQTGNTVSVTDIRLKKGMEVERVRFPGTNFNKTIDLKLVRVVANVESIWAYDCVVEEVVVNYEDNPSAKQAPAPAPAPAPSLSQTQPALRDPDYHMYTIIDGLVARSYEKEKAKRGLPSFDIWTDMLQIQYKELNKKYGGCFDKDLLSDDDLECADEENDEIFIDVTNLNSDDSREAEKRNDEEECAAEENLSDPKVVSNVGFGDEGNQNRDFDDGKPDDSNIYAQRCISQYLLHSNVIPASADMVEDGSASVVGSGRRRKSDGLGCTFNCGMADDKDVIHSLIEDEGKEYENKEPNLQKLFDTWDEFVSKSTVPCNWKANLIFVWMVWEDHYLCVCINFTSEMVEVLDNTKYDKWEETTIYKATDLLASHMSDYLEEKGDERAVELVGFPVVHIKFNWKTYEENNIESGNFLMMHMIRYEGEIFEADLKSKVYRRYYWAEMAAALLLADINEERTHLINRVKELSATKDEIKKEVKPKRGKTGTVKEKKGVAEEEGEKVNSPTKNTEILVLYNPPRQYHTVHGDIDDGEPKRVFKRYKRLAHSRGRGHGRGRGRGRNCSQ
ncbi:hypothetical protein KSS87_009729 [Heliosperma pusillum]|nr:hypothetical protein KSS87_009729 [Heliosperma pusillum]